MLALLCLGDKIANTQFMIELIASIEKNECVLLTAPPGWGKTYKILHALKMSKRKVYFIFPLRALCEEVYKNALSLGLDVGLIHKKSKKKDYKQLMICTPEGFKLGERDQEALFILDEFHLFYYWGETFRSYMLECYYEIASSSYALMMLSATISKELKGRINGDLALNYEDIFHIDFGNQRLKNLPSKIFYYPKVFKNYLLDEIFYPREGVSLIFCPYRSQVESLSKQLKSRNFIVLSCIGGQAKQFVKDMEKIKTPNYIVATSVISHGVNLPQIERICFLSEIDNIDYYLQMAGRGGRNGEKYEIHTFNKDYFGQRKILNGLLRVLVRRVINKINKIIERAYED